MPSERRGRETERKRQLAVPRTKLKRSHRLYTYCSLPQLVLHVPPRCVGILTRAYSEKSTAFLARFPDYRGLGWHGVPRNWAQIAGWIMRDYEAADYVDICAICQRTVCRLTVSLWQLFRRMRAELIV